jgi:hypothetical protein
VGIGVGIAVGTAVDSVVGVSVGVTAGVNAGGIVVAGAGVGVGFGEGEGDARADLYSLGVLLLYLLPNQDVIKHRELTRVLHRCTAFAPENRYPSAGAVKAALLRTGKSRVPRFIVSALIISLTLAAVFVLNWFLSNTPSTLQEIVFQEPLIERAVRVMLGFDDDKVITEYDLRLVQELFLSANRVYSTLEAYHDDVWGIRQSSISYAYPLLNTLDDLHMMPNIHTLCIANQRIRNLEPLLHLPFLSHLNLYNMPIIDLSPLRDVSRLNNVLLHGLPASDLTPLLDIPNLFLLGITNLPISDPATFRYFHNVRHFYITGDRVHIYQYLPDAPLITLYLNTTDFASFDWIEQYKRSLHTLILNNTRLTDLSGIEAFEYLEHIAIHRSSINDLTPLLSLPNLQTLTIDASMRSAADTIRNMAHFEIILM